jgi:SAM-dependent methyltransferase
MNSLPSPSYKDIFESRGALHAQAFQLYPDSVLEEAKLIIDSANLASDQTLLDIPSASGFLKNYITTPNIHLIAIDPSPQMHNLCKSNVANSLCAPLNNLPLSNQIIDRIICLAGLHHEPDLLSFFLEIHRVLKDDGLFVIGEVDENSSVSIFLNEFVDQHSTTGHQGIFFNSQYELKLKKANFEIVNNQLKFYHWRFESHAHLADCLIKMFGIDLADPKKVIDAAIDILGIDEFNDYIGMRWSLRHVTCKKRIEI